MAERWSMTRRWFGGLTMVLGCLLAALPASAQSNTAGYLELTGILDEPSISFLERELAAAGDGRVAALIVRVDSPGGLEAPVARAAEAIRSSRVPVIAWVAAGEARAGSAAAALALSAHHLVMAPGATIGPALPLDLTDFREQTPQERAADRQAVEGAVSMSERDIDGQARAALERESIPAERARDLGLADSIAPNVQELLASLQGETVRSRSGTVTFSQEPFTLRFVKMTLLERLMHSAARPEFAYLLLLIGVFGLIFELYNPGIGAAGLGGGIALMFSFYSFTELPTSWAALAAVLAGLGLLSVDLKTSSLGPFSIAGLLALAGGSLLLYAGAHPALRMPLWAPVAGVAMTLVFFLQVMTSAIRARTAKPLPGADGIMGAVGIARTDISPDGQVMARGTLWRARTLGAAIGQGTPVKIKGVSGLMLMVEPTSELPPDGA